MDENCVIVAKRFEEKVNGLMKGTKERQLTKKKKKKRPNVFKGYISKQIIVKNSFK
jgi:uncharacterized protein YnzC (UPF0291/DUF896 family)